MDGTGARTGRLELAFKLMGSGSDVSVKAGARIICEAEKLLKLQNEDIRNVLLLARRHPSVGPAIKELEKESGRKLLTIPLSEQERLLGRAVTVEALGELRELPSNVDVALFDYRLFSRHTKTLAGGGGFVEETAKAESTATIGKKAIVYEDAKVIDFARAEGNTEVCGKAVLLDGAAVNAEIISGTAVIGGITRLNGAISVSSGNLMTNLIFTTQASVDKWIKIQEAFALKNGIEPIDLRSLLR